MAGACVLRDGGGRVLTFQECGSPLNIYLQLTSGKYAI